MIAKKLNAALFKDFKKRWIIIKRLLISLCSVIFSIVGSFFLLRSSYLGLKYTEKILSDRGQMNADNFNSLMQSSVEAFKWFGIILLIGGLLTLILTVYSSLQKLK